jgi:NADH-quinone oxidoreductase subunit K
MITQFHLTVFSLLIFTVGIFGILYNRKNFIVILIAIEIILLGANINFVAVSAERDDPAGVIFYLLILTVAAAEAAIALAILSLYSRNAKNIAIRDAVRLKG